jgi:hypothetical protein
MPRSGGHTVPSNEMNRLNCFLCALLLPVTSPAEVVCALGPASSAYNAYLDQRPTADAMQLAGRVNEMLKSICSPKCPVIALFRNASAANAMLIAGTDQAKIVYAPQFFTSVYDNFGDGAIIGIIAHEMGHPLDETAPARWMSGIPSPELRADAWAGCILARNDLSSGDLSGALTAISKYPSPAHPAWGVRLPALKLGYGQCGGNASIFDTAVSRSKLAGGRHLP